MSDSQPLVNVRFFASLREDVGHAEVQLPAISFAQLRVGLEGLLSAQAIHRLSEEGVRIALNQDLIAEQDLESLQLQQGDEVAFLPPVTGG